MAAFTYSPITVDGSGTLSGKAWGPGAASCRITAPLNSDEIQDEISLNQLLYGLNNVFAQMGGADVPVTTATLSIGSTDITLACTQSWISINGVIESVAALTAQAFGSLGTIPANTWGVIKCERATGGTMTFQSAAANYTTGYATEALAIAAMPATGANEVAVGYVTILASGDGWVAGTDALAGGTGGNPADGTNYYSYAGCADTGVYAAALQIANKGGTVVTTTAG